MRSQTLTTVCWFWISKIMSKAPISIKMKIFVWSPIWKIVNWISFSFRQISWKISPILFWIFWFKITFSYILFFHVCSTRIFDIFCKKLWNVTETHPDFVYFWTYQSKEKLNTHIIFNFIPSEFQYLSES